MILQKIRVGEPGILMGETGCGKTYLVKYMAKVLFRERAEFRKFIFHYGISEARFIKFVKDVMDEANENLKASNEKRKIFWVFFDEFNTSHLQAYVSELMHDRIFSLPEYHPGMSFLRFIIWLIQDYLETICYIK